MINSTLNLILTKIIFLLVLKTSKKGIQINSNQKRPRNKEQHPLTTQWLLVQSMQQKQLKLWPIRLINQVVGSQMLAA